MTSGISRSFLPDTNVFVPILNQEETALKRLDGTTVFLCSIVLGELYFGARNSGRVKENLEKVERLAAAHPVLNCDKSTADIYSQIKLSLRVKGKPIPENDIWIAALAQQHDLTLVTRDEHFRHVDGMVVVKW